LGFQVTADFASLMTEEEEFGQYSDSDTDATAFLSTTGSRN
jgi:hypothetical protein